MNDYSTLIYFVNNFQKEETFNSTEIESRLEKALTNLGAQNAAPSDATIKNILDFACSYDVMETKETGYVEMNLN